MVVHLTRAVTNLAFEAFSCFEFQGGRGFLQADVAIECGTREHEEGQRLAWLAIGLYPVGILVLSAALLIWTRVDNGSDWHPKTPVSRAISFLTREYKPSYGAYLEIEVGT